MPKMSRITLTVVLFSLCAGLTAGAQTVVPYVNRTVFSTAAPDATNTFGFEEFSLPSGTGTGFLPDFTELGYVTFLTNSNYQQEIIDGRNVGQGDNDVYTTLASDKSGTIADITFGGGVFSLGFDLKNTANGGTAISQEFTIHLFSGSTALGDFVVLSPVGGSLFQFVGFTSDTPITELTISSLNASPNLDVVLDNFQLAAPVPEPGTIALAVLGGVGLIVARNRRKKGRNIR